MNSVSESKFVSWLPWLVLAVSLSAAVWSYKIATAHGSLGARTRFDARVEEIKTAVQDRIRIYEQLLYGARGLFASSWSVERHEWRQYFESVKIAANYPGVRGAGFVTHVPRKNMDGFLLAARADGAPDFRVHPPGIRDEYFVITYIEPVAENIHLFGFDIGTDTAVHRIAAEMARDKDLPTISGKFSYLDDTNSQSGFLSLLPVYRNGSPVGTVDERRKALTGWIYVRFSLDDLMQGIPGSGPQDIDFEIYDGIEMSPKSILYRTSPGPGIVHLPDRPTFAHASTLEVGSRVWMLNFRTRPEFDAATDRNQPTLVLVAGLLGSLLLFSITWSLVATRRMALAQAEAMTAKLRQAQKDLLVARDIAVAASLAKSEFLANMSHELRAPLNSVIGFANILQENKDRRLRDDELAYLDRILENGNHLLSLINEVLDISRVEARQMKLDIEPVYLDVFIQETLDLMGARVLGRSIQLIADLPRPMAPLHTDHTKLRQVLINLINNAIKFTEKGSVTVRVAVDLESRSPYRIDVIDTGIGIPKDRQELIFAPFQQADGVTAKRYGGTGLGLTISRSLCELMGYRLDVESEIDKGSTFSIVLPPSPRKTEEQQERISEWLDASSGWASASGAVGSGVETDFSGRSVLVIDDEPDSRLLLSHHLQDLGLQVYSAGSGEQGLRLARERKPDLITVDLLMREKNGWEIVKEIRASRDLRSIPVVVVSNIADENRGTFQGTVDILNKPVTREGLEEVLRKKLPA